MRWSESRRFNSIGSWAGGRNPCERGRRSSAGPRAPCPSPQPHIPPLLIDSTPSPGPPNGKPDRTAVLHGEPSNSFPENTVPFGAREQIPLGPASGYAWRWLEMQSLGPSPGDLCPGLGQAVEAEAWREHASERKRRGAQPSPGSGLETSLASTRPNPEADKSHRSNGQSLSRPRPSAGPTRAGAHETGCRLPGPHLLEAPSHSGSGKTKVLVTPLQTPPLLTVHQGLPSARPPRPPQLSR